jgi:sterol desaturase/sphingolipid hydroxylase (fatty acid hydroxylase superfamily)
MTLLEGWYAQWTRLLSDDTPRLAVAAGLYLLFTALEHFFPAEAGQGMRGRWRNVALATLFVLLGLAGNGAILALHPIQIPSAALGAGLGTSLLLCLVYLFAVDFFYYWYHRAQHRFPLLWSIHELHHTDPQLNVTTSMRTYWIETPIQFLVVVLPGLFLLGAEPRALAMMPFATTLGLLFVHSNLRLRMGRLTPVLTGPQLHRLHHSSLAPHQNKNFAQFFPILDVVFRTYRRPDRDEFPPTGVRGVDGDASIPSLLLRPVHVIREGLRPGAPSRGTRPPVRRRGGRRTAKHRRRRRA